VPSSSPAVMWQPYCFRPARSSWTFRCPPARTLIEEGAVVALATDFNPGSSFCESLPLVMSLACTRLKMSPAEALTGCTANASHVLGLSGEVGRLASGYQADVLVLDAPDWRYLAYHLGETGSPPG
jgi:imidazolonepropionase